MLINVIEIATPEEIPAGENHVLVKYGKANKVTRHSRGLIMEVDEQLPGELRDFSFASEIESAKQIAAKEGIRTVLILRALG